MKKLVLVLGVVALMVSVAVTAAVAKPTKKSASADICVLLPDPKSSVRWETQDRPALVAAFKKANVSYVITNAGGDAAEAEDAGRPVPLERRQGRHPRLARRRLLDRDREGCGREEREGDRVRPPGQGRHGVDLHLVRRPAKVGVLQGQGVVAGLKANGMYGKKPVVAELNGGQTDNNSYLVQGRIRLRS